MSVDISNATATAGVDPSRVRIAGAIKQAANTTGISFEYLLATAKMESNFNPKEPPRPRRRVGSINSSTRPGSAP